MGYKFSNRSFHPKADELKKGVDIHLKHFLRKLLKGDKLYYCTMLFGWKLRTQSMPYVIRYFSRKRLRAKQALFRDTPLQLLTLATPDGMNQCTHPDLLKRRDGSYLLTLTPYPFGLDQFERPVIYQSSDLTEWTYVAGPIDSQQAGPHNHLSDPTLVELEDGEIVCYYRESVYSCAKPLTNIYCMHSKDGCSWSGKEVLVSEVEAEFDVLSPSVRRSEQRGLHAYFCLKQGNSIRLMYTQGCLFEKSSLREVDLSGNLPQGKTLWHVSHICGKEQDILLLTLSEAPGGRNAELYLGTIDTQTLVLKSLKKLSVREYVPSIAIAYRATGILDKDHLTIIASVQFDDRTWGCVKYDTAADPANWSRPERGTNPPI